MLIAPTDVIGFNRTADALGNECAVIHARACENHEGFLPPIAADHILSAEVVSEGGSDHLKDSITGVVAEGVIEILEMVNINHDCADRHAVARGAGIFFFKAAHAKTSVENISEVINGGELGDFLMENGVIQIGCGKGAQGFKYFFLLR